MEINVVLLCETVNFAFVPNSEQNSTIQHGLVLINCNCKLLEKNNLEATVNS